MPPGGPHAAPPLTPAPLVVFCHGMDGRPDGPKPAALRAAGLEVLSPDHVNLYLSERIKRLRPGAAPVGLLCPFASGWRSQHTPTFFAIVRQHFHVLLAFPFCHYHIIMDERWCISVSVRKAFVGFGKNVHLFFFGTRAHIRLQVCGDCSNRPAEDGKAQLTPAGLLVRSLPRRSGWPLPVGAATEAGAEGAPATDRSGGVQPGGDHRPRHRHPPVQCPGPTAHVAPNPAGVGPS